MHDELATAAEGHTVHRCHGRNHRIAQGLGRGLELLDDALDFFQAAGHQGISDIECARGFQNGRLRLALELLHHRTESRRFLFALASASTGEIRPN